MRLKYAIAVIILAIIAIYFLGYTQGHKKRDRASQTLIDAQESIIYKYRTRIGDDSVYIYKTEQELKTERQARKAGDIERKELRALNLKQVNEISRLKLRVDTLLEDISHTGTIIRIDTVFVDSMPHNAILLPFKFNKTDQWLSLKGNFNSEGKLSVDLKINVDIDLWTGIDKKTKQPTSIVTTKSPYISVIGIKSQKYDFPKPKKMGIGFIGGYGMSKTGLTPFVGFGVSYNLIRF